MNLRAGYPFWLIQNGLPYDYPKLEKNASTDVLVMGGGISGALVAHYLICEGVSCIVADARTIGLGSTCASTSLLQYEIDNPLHKLVDMVGKKNAFRAYQLCGQAIIKLGKLARQVGLESFHFKNSLYYAAHKKDLDYLEKESVVRKQAGFDVQLLTEREVSQYGFKAPGALLSVLGAETDAYLFTHHLHQYNLRKGLEVYDRTEIKSVKRNKRGVIAKTPNGHTIKAKKIVYATGYEVTEQISKPIVKLHSTYATISEILSPAQRTWKDDVLIWNTADPYLYLRTTPDKRIVVGGRDELFYTAAKRDRLIKAKGKSLQKDFKKLFPHIPYSPEFTWTGTFGSTKDGLPYIGAYKKMPHSYFVLGFGGNGITFSQVAAEIVAGLVKGRENKDVEIFSFTR